MQTPDESLDVVEEAGIECTLGSRSRAIWTHQDALECFTQGQIQAKVRAGVWKQLFAAVYAVTEMLTAEQWGIAAVLASGGSGQLSTESLDPSLAVVAGRSAARIWGFTLIDDKDPTTRARDHLQHDVITHRARPRRSGRQLDAESRPIDAKTGAGGSKRKVRFGGRVINRHAWDLRADEVVRLPSGLWVTNRVRTALDCVGLLEDDAAVCLFDQALRKKAVTAEQLRRGIAAREGSKGVKKLRWALAHSDRRAESAAETLARLLLLPWLPELVPQLALCDEEGEVLARFDLALPSIKLAIEADSREGHEGWQMVAKDRRRDRVSRSYGWHTERVTWVELRRKPQVFVTEIRVQAAQLRARAAA